MNFKRISSHLMFRSISIFWPDLRYIESRCLIYGWFVNVEDVLESFQISPHIDSGRWIHPKQRPFFRRDDGCFFLPWLLQWGQINW